jgi:hypothetical protein
MPWRHVEEWGYSSSILNLGTGWRWVVSFTLQPIFPGEIVPCTHRIGGLVGFRDGLDAVEARKILPLPEIELRPSSSYPVTIPTELSRSEGKVKSSLCLTNYALRHEDVWGSGCIDQRLFDLGTSWRWVVSFTSRLLYPRVRSPSYRLDRKLGGPQRRSERHREVKILTTTGTRTPTPWSSSPDGKVKYKKVFSNIFLIFETNYAPYFIILTRKICEYKNIFSAGEKAPGTHWIESLEGQRAVIDVVEKRKISCPCWESNLSRPARHLSLILTELSRLLILIVI